VTVRWLLHPLTSAIALAGAASVGVALAVVAAPGRPLGGVALLLVAGAAAGFANSGST
jgi:hypothetical protein